MKVAQFKALLDSIGSLTTAQLTELSGLVSASKSKQVSREALDSMAPKACPRCACTTVVRNGVRNGLQRYACRGCHKTYNATTGTPLSRLRDKELFEAYAQCMRKRMTIRESAQELGLTLVVDDNYLGRLTTTMLAG